ncbi:thioredoxin-2-like [Artemia franciscana]|uniref:Thioredoxin n=1 Tax=Artemia franciscana TaxID=6661 RepID=A0AA88LJH5_ARTSF|nr:hypothetical protein QYM36_000863 [Artemia franciscana]
MVRQIKDKEEYDQVLAECGSKLVVIDFYATWCGPCKMISPKVQEMAEAYADVVFLKVDVDESEELALEFNVNCMPTFILMKNGQRAAEFSGANAEKLRELIVQHK